MSLGKIYALSLVLLSSHYTHVSLNQYDALTSRAMPIEKKNIIYEPRHEVSNKVVCAISKGSDQPAHTRKLIRAFASRLNII